MAAVYFRIVPTQTYEDLLYASREARDLYLWMSLGPHSSRNGLVSFHRREPDRIVGAGGVDPALLELASEGFVSWVEVGSRRAVFLRPHVEHFAPRGRNELRGWINDAESEPDSGAKSAWLEALIAKCAKTYDALVQPLQDPSATPPKPLGDKEEKRTEEKRTKEKISPLREKVATAPKTAPKAKPKRKPTLAQNPPTMDEVSPYAAELGFTAAALTEWFEHWTSVGWRSKSTSYRDWRAMLRKRKAQLQSWGKWEQRRVGASVSAKKVLAWTCTLDEWLAHKGVAAGTWECESAVRGWHSLNNLEVSDEEARELAGNYGDAHEERGPSAVGRPNGMCGRDGAAEA